MLTHSKKYKLVKKNGLKLKDVLKFKLRASSSSYLEKILNLILQFYTKKFKIKVHFFMSSKINSKIRLLF
jgi:hypothetical protein